MKKTTIYSVYYVDTKKNDINYIREYNNIQEIAQDYKLTNKKSVYHFIINSLDNINLLELKHKLKDKYIIFKDEIIESELY